MYLACDWIINIRKAEYLLDAVRIMESLGGDLRLLNFRQRGNENFLFDTFAVQVPSKDLLNRFADQVGNEMGFQSWYSISQDVYESAEINLTTKEEDVIREITHSYVSSSGLHNLKTEAAKEGRYYFGKGTEKLGLKPENTKKLKDNHIDSVKAAQDLLHRHERYSVQFPELDEDLIVDLRSNLKKQGFWPKEGEKFIEDLQLEPGTLWVLHLYGVTTDADLLKLINKGKDFLLTIYGLDEQKLKVLMNRLYELGYDKLLD